MFGLPLFFQGWTVYLKFYSHCNSNIQSVHVVQCRFYSMHHPFALCMTIYFASRLEPYCPRWPPPREMLMDEISNKQRKERKECFWGH